MWTTAATRTDIPTELQITTTTKCVEVLAAMTTNAQIRIVHSAAEMPAVQT